MSSEALSRLETILASTGPLAIAVSGGVDSLTLATAAHRLLRGAAAMHHAVSPAVPPEATARTRAIAETEGWPLDVFDAGEFADPGYRANPANRCFFCKINLYGAIARRTAHVIASGTNLDDLADWRPGLEAARAHGVRHPLVEAGIDKDGVRALAAELGLGSVAELPAAPCLSSRVETGIRIEAPVLEAIHAAERLLAAEIRPATIRCRVRAGRIVLELDAAALDRLDDADRARWQDRVAAVMAGAGVGDPVSFAPYRTGSAFLRPAA